MLQELNLHIRRNDVDLLRGFDRRWQDAAQHINFCVQIDRWQINNARHLIHQLP